MLIPIDQTPPADPWTWRTMEFWIPETESRKVKYEKANRKLAKEVGQRVRTRRDYQTSWVRDKRADEAESRIIQRKGLPFVVWDGEGCNDSDGTMSYVLFGHNGVTDTGSYITGRRLSTHECLEFMWEQHNELGKDYIHCSFGFGFDVDQILRDLPEDKLVELKAENEVTWEGWKINHISRKFFTLSKGRSRGFTIYDTNSFFHSNLIGAAREYVADDPRIEVVAKGKASRDSFDYRELNSLIIPYWRLEGKLMVAVMNALRASLVGAGIHLDKWHGPGAIAESLIVREKLAEHIQRSRTEMPDEVTEATAFAYFGGRFENFIMGHIDSPVYAYDIRSAYPAALSQCPVLVNGEWVRTTDVDAWGIYKVTGMMPLPDNPVKAFMAHGAFPSREANGSVHFPLCSTGWYYGHEVIAAQLCGWNIEVMDGWQYQQRQYEGSAFQFLSDMYRQRAAYKRAGNPAQLACKLGINSVYGKLAQLTGWDEVNNLPPKYHHQWYAGHTTSWTRARLMLAMNQAPESIIACETDGIYSLSPLNLKIGTELGEWELETYDEMLYVQSGVYFAKHNGKWIKARTRGLATGHVTVDDALSALPGLKSILSTSRRYGSMTGYIGRERHWKWFDEERTFDWGGGGKRIHDTKTCVCGEDPDSRIHINRITQPLGAEFSAPRKLPWVMPETDDWTGDEDVELEAVSLL